MKIKTLLLAASFGFYITFVHICALQIQLKRSVQLHWFMVFSTDSVMALKKRLDKDQNFRPHNINKWRKHGNLQSLTNVHKLIAWSGEKQEIQISLLRFTFLFSQSIMLHPYFTSALKFNSSGSKIYFPCIKKK